MRIHDKLVFLVVASVGMASQAFACSSAAEAVKTGFTVLVGFPASGTTPNDLVMLGPGVVVSLDAATRDTPSGEPRQLIEKSLSMAKATEKLWAAFRLDPARKRQEGVQEWMQIGKVLEMPVLKDVQVRVSATLQKFSETSAAYKIVFQQEEKILADSTVQVMRGGRTVVGGMDGKEAPYIFLLIEPEKPGISRSQSIDAKRVGGFTEPRVLHQINPEYPLECKKEKIQGEVVLSAVIEEEGKVQEVEILQAPDPRLGEAAKAAVLQWIFTPARNKEGQAVRTISTITIRFALK